MVLITAGAATAAIVASGEGRLDAFAYAQQSVIVETVSTEYELVPSMEVEFSTQSPNTSAIMSFCDSGNMYGAGTGSTQLRSEVDGETPIGGLQWMTSQDSSVLPRCFEWVVEIGRGRHSARVLWKVTQGVDSSLTARFFATSLKVSY